VNEHNITSREDQSRKELFVAKCKVSVNRYKGPRSENPPNKLLAVTSQGQIQGFKRGVEEI
jgi:hypothetical protein